MSPRNDKNYYQRYYNCPERYCNTEAGKTIGKMVAGKRKEKTITEKQKAYYEDILAFCREKQIEVTIFEKPRNKFDCSSKIRGLITTMKKHGVYEEFRERSAANE